MIGHQPLIEMRRKGLLPCKHIFLIDGVDEIDTDYAKHWHEEVGPITGILVPHVLVEGKDVIERLDLRFCVGLTVHIYAKRGDERAFRLFKAVREAHPDRIGCVTSQYILFYSKEIGGNGKRIHA